MDDTLSKHTHSTAGQLVLAGAAGIKGEKQEEESDSAVAVCTLHLIHHVKAVFVHIKSKAG